MALPRLWRPSLAMRSIRDASRRPRWKAGADIGEGGLHSRHWIWDEAIRILALTSYRATRAPLREAGVPTGRRHATARSQTSGVTAHARSKAIMATSCRRPIPSHPATVCRMRNVRSIDLRPDGIDRTRCGFEADRRHPAASRACRWRPTGRPAICSRTTDREGDRPAGTQSPACCVVRGQEPDAVNGRIAVVVPTAADGAASPVAAAARPERSRRRQGRRRARTFAADAAGLPGLDAAAALVPKSSGSKTS